MEDFIKQLKAGHPKAIEQLVDTYQDMLLNLLLRIVRDPHEAEDLLQETFIRAMEAIKNYTHQGKFSGWICTIATNLAKDHLRKQKRQNTLCVDSLYTVSKQPGPDKAFAQTETQKIIHKAIELLPMEQKEVFLLREEAGMSFHEIAKALGISINTALGRMHYAIKKLKSQLQEI